MIRTSNLSGNIAIDHIAEYGVIGCWLTGWHDDDLDPLWISSEQRRLMFLAVDALDANGELVRAREPYSFAEQRGIGARNAEIASHLIERSKLWHWDSEVRQQYGRCLGVATMPQIVDHYVRRLREVHRQHREVWAAEDRLREALEGVTGCR